MMRHVSTLASVVVMAGTAVTEWGTAFLYGMPPRLWVMPGAGVFASWGAAIYRAELRLVQVLARRPGRTPT